LFILMDAPLMQNFHEPILSGISLEGEARIGEVGKECVRRVGLSEEEIKKLYG
jgi:hypothetical protein